MNPEVAETRSCGRSHLARIDVDQYHRMLETRILVEGAPIELLDGLLVYKDRSAHGEDPMTIGKHHNLGVSLLAELNPELRSRGCYLQMQGPLTLRPRHEPEPDGAILRGTPRGYADRLPEAADVLVLFEVADSSLEHDRTAKLEIYARAGIPRYAIVNLIDRRIEWFERPIPAEGRYGRSVTLAAEETLVLELEGGRLDVPVRDLLP